MRASIRYFRGGSSHSRGSCSAGESRPASLRHPAAYLPTSHSEEDKAIAAAQALEERRPRSAVLSRALL